MLSGQWTGAAHAHGDPPEDRGHAQGGEGRARRLTLSSSSGRSPPSLMPRFMVTKRSAVGLSRTLWLCRLVLSMMMAKDST